MRNVTEYEAAVGDAPGSAVAGVDGDAGLGDAIGAVAVDAAPDEPARGPDRDARPPPPDLRAEIASAAGDADAAATGKEGVVLVPAEARPSSSFVPRITIGAFAESAVLRNVFVEAGRDRRLSRAVLSPVEGGFEAAIRRYEERPTPDLIILETDLETEALFEALDRLAGLCPTETKLVLIGYRNDVALYRRLQRFGVGDYLVGPLDSLALIESIAQLFQTGDDQTLGKVTAFLGARGGAGTTSIALNIAAAVAKQTESAVLVLDFDLAFGTVALDLNIEPVNTIADALAEGDDLDAVLLDRLTTARDGRLSVLAAPARLDHAAPPSPETVIHLIQTARALTPHLLIDLPHGVWAPWLSDAFLQADEPVIVATPDLGALRNARNLFAAARSARPNDPPPRLILNQCGVPRRKEVAAADFRRVVDVDPTLVIPFDPVRFGEASAKGTLVAETGAGDDLAVTFARLAASLTGRECAEPAKTSGLAGLTRRWRGRA